VLAGAGGCTAYDVVLILKRGRHDVRRLLGQAHGRARRGGPQGVHGASTCTSPCPAKAFPRLAVERAIAMSHEKYCSASIMLGKTATSPPVSTFELIGRL
jgi:putative redox protein